MEEYKFGGETYFLLDDICEYTDSSKTYLPIAISTIISTTEYVELLEESLKSFRIKNSIKKKPSSSIIVSKRAKDILISIPKLRILAEIVTKYNIISNMCKTFRS